MHFHWKKILQTSKNARTMSTWNSSIRIWRFHRHGPGSIPGMGIPNAITDVLENFCTILIPCGLVVSIWHSSSPPWPEFDSRHRNSRSNIFQRPNSRIFPKAIDLRPRFLSLINSCLPHIITMTTIQFFFFDYDDCLVYGQRHNTSKEHWITFFGIIFRTINSDTDPLLLKTDLKTIEEHSKNVNLKLNEINKCNILRVTLMHNIVINP